jgi:hypothetical protein
VQAGKTSGFQHQAERPQPFERHYSPQELASIWKLDESTVRRLFADEPGVLKIGATGRRRRRDYVTLRIPESVAARFHQRRSGRTEC